MLIRFVLTGTWIPDTHVDNNLQKPKQAWLVLELNPTERILETPSVFPIL